MKSIPSIFIKLLLTILCFSVFCVTAEYDFFNFVQQWPVAACNTKEGCCYSRTWKPEAKFTIFQFGPVDHDGTVHFNCTDNHFNSSKISDLTPTLQSKWPTLFCPTIEPSKKWAQAWDARGTCSESVFDQHAYFQTAIDLSNTIDLVTILNMTGTTANNRLRTRSEIAETISNATGGDAFIECNLDSEGNKQLHKIFMCIDKYGKKAIYCPPGGYPLYYMVCDSEDLVKIPLSF